MKRALFISIRPKYVSRIIDGLKKVEFRRVCPNVCAGDLLFIYASSPQRKLECHSVVKELSRGTPESLWRKFREMSGLTRTEFKSYFLGAEVGFAIHLGPVARFDVPIPLSSLREIWPGFSPPQIYRYVTHAEYSNLFAISAGQNGGNGG